MKLVLVAFLLFVCIVSNAVADDQTDIIQALQAGDRAELEKAAISILESASTRSGIDLVMASVALTEKSRDDALFLNYIGILRTKIDMKLFEPKGKGGNSPWLAIDAISSRAREVLTIKIMSDKTAFHKLIDRIQDWEVKYTDNYDPGWEYEKALSTDQAKILFEKLKSSLISRMQDLQTLLTNDEYYKTIIDIQRFYPTEEERLRAIQKSMNGEDVQIDFEEYQKDIDKLTSIEKELDIEGIFYRRKASKNIKIDQDNQ
jgi:hypothetical protein